MYYECPDVLDVEVVGHIWDPISNLEKITFPMTYGVTFNS